MRRSIIVAVVSTAALLAVAAEAAETITYTYDARGRVISVAHAGTVNNNVVTNYAYDHADNRATKTTTGSPNPGPP